MQSPHALEMRGLLLSFPSSAALGPCSCPLPHRSWLQPPLATPFEYPKPGDYSRGTWWAGACLHHLPPSPMSQYPLLTLPQGQNGSTLRLAPVTPTRLWAHCLLPYIFTQSCGPSRPQPSTSCHPGSLHPRPPLPLPAHFLLAHQPSHDSSANPASGLWVLRPLWCFDPAVLGMME